MIREITKVPPAKSLIQGLRCIGYNFSTALSDIIDNSISAFAKNINIITNPDDDPYVAILDDGIGMGLNELENAMTLGSERNKDDSEIELGRFGLGLKSASFSQCLTLIVASKRCSKTNAMRYDLKKIESTNMWILDVLGQEEINLLPEIEQLNAMKSGTLVIWKDFDKIEGEAKSFKESFINTIGNAKKHVEYVFHRFYDNVIIKFNGHVIDRRDPFLVGFGQQGRTQKILVDNDYIVVTPYVLPYVNMLTEEHKKLLGNPKSIYEDQGIYIYRNKRLIIWGNWLRMGIRREFNKLARVLVDIPSSLDSVWMLDVKKSSAKIPDKIKEQLYISIKDSIIRSEREVKYPGKKEQEVEFPIWRRVDLHGGNVKYEINRDENPIYNELLNTLDKGQSFLLNAFLNKIEQFIPKGLIINDNADSINILNSDEQLVEDELIEEIIFLSQYQEGNLLTFLETLLTSQDYSKVAYRKSEILERLKNE